MKQKLKPADDRYTGIMQNVITAYECVDRFMGYIAVGIMFTVT